MDKTKKIDLFRELKSDYSLSKKPVMFEVTPGNYLAIEGQGEPGGESFQQSVEALYGMAYTIKMTRKSLGLGDYVVCKLEAVWWADGTDDCWEVDPKLYRWRLMIRTPEVVGDQDLQEASKVLMSKGKAVEVEKVRLLHMDEGQCVQMLHVGPYDKEHETVALMEGFMAENKVRKSGMHHEIYISDPRRIEPERLKTILRLPVCSELLKE